MKLHSVTMCKSPCEREARAQIISGVRTALWWAAAGGGSVSASDELHARNRARL